MAGVGNSINPRWGRRVPWSSLSCSGLFYGLNEDECTPEFKVNWLISRILPSPLETTLLVLLTPTWCVGDQSDDHDSIAIGAAGWVLGAWPKASDGEFPRTWTSIRRAVMNLRGRMMVWSGAVHRIHKWTNLFFINFNIDVSYGFPISRSIFSKVQQQSSLASSRSTGRCI